MDAVVYTRVSKLADGRSVEDQERECRAVCKHNDWPVRAVFTDDGVSASRFGKDRPAWMALKSELRKGDVLVVWEASRAHRDLGEDVKLRDLCSSLDVPLSYSGRILDLSRGDDRFSAGLDALVAERESEQIRERVNRGKRSSAAMGTPSTRAPWGYVMTRAIAADGKLRPQFEIDPNEADRIREAVRRLLDGNTMYSVKQWIEQTEGFKPSSITNLKRSLTNPAIAGLRVHQGNVVGKASWEPIITEEQHYQLVERLKRPPGNHPGPEPKHLLSGIAKCSECGEGLRWKRYRGKRNPGYECYRGHCSREASAMDAAVEKKLFWLLPMLVAAYAAANPSVMTPNTEEATRKIGELEGKLEEWRQAAIAGEVTPASFATIEKGIVSQIDTLRRETASKLRLPDPGGVEKRWSTMSIRERRDTLREWLDITVVPAERRGARTGRLLIELGGEMLASGIMTKQTLSTPEEILEALESHVSAPLALSSRRAVVTRKHPGGKHLGTEGPDGGIGANQ